MKIKYPMAAVSIILVFLLSCQAVSQFFIPTPTTTPLPTSTPVLDIGSTMLGKDGMTMLYVPAGEFIMGSDQDPEPHQVYLDAFWIDKTEVTNALYSKCVGENACKPPIRLVSNTRDSYYGNHEFDDYPVLQVNWFMAVEYCNWAGRNLPTEAQWEKAARGTDERMYPWGNEPPNHTLLNYTKEFRDTTPVGTYPDGASPYGALDMAGNAWEWVADWGNATYYSASPVSNPLGPDTGTMRIVRGGTWNHGSDAVRSAYRILGTPESGDYYTGFRCAQPAP